MPGATVSSRTPVQAANQTFAVDATLSDGSFKDNLTHNGISIFGRCITDSASIVGHRNHQRPNKD